MRHHDGSPVKARVAHPGVTRFRLSPIVEAAPRGLASVLDLVAGSLIASKVDDSPSVDDLLEQLRGDKAAHPCPRLRVVREDAHGRGRDVAVT
jgi:hypothetical protein